MAGNMVLLVERDRALRAALREFLHLRGFGVLEAETGPEALTLVDQHRPDMVLLDLSLPDEDGLVVAHELLQRCPTSGLPIGLFASALPAGQGARLLARISVGPTESLLALERLEPDLRLLFDAQPHRSRRSPPRRAARPPARCRRVTSSRRRIVPSREPSGPRANEAEGSGGEGSE